MADDDMTIRHLFDQYAALSHVGALGGSKPEIDSSRFSKFCNEAGLVDKIVFHQSDVDIIFTKFKNPKTKKLDYNLFIQALEEVARRKETDLDSLLDFINSVGSDGPKITGTVAESNRFYDDRSTFTGAAARGGLTIREENPVGFWNSNGYGYNNLKAKTDVRGMTAPISTTHVSSLIVPKNRWGSPISMGARDGGGNDDGYDSEGNERRRNPSPKPRRQISIHNKPFSHSTSGGRHTLFGNPPSKRRNSCIEPFTSSRGHKRSQSPTLSRSVSPGRRPSPHGVALIEDDPAAQTINQLTPDGYRIARVCYDVYASRDLAYADEEPAVLGIDGGRFRRFILDYRKVSNVLII